VGQCNLALSSESWYFGRCFLSSIAIQVFFLCQEAQNLIIILEYVVECIVLYVPTLVLASVRRGLRRSVFFSCFYAWRSSSMPAPREQLCTYHAIGMRGVADLECPTTLYCTRSDWLACSFLKSVFVFKIGERDLPLR
jgi:hypothetical protein